MDIHVNDLIIEDGFKEVALDTLSFRDIDQEFIFIKTVDSFDTETSNLLYYCFIKPYEGLFFRRIGETDEQSNKIYVDEGMTDIEDIPYEDISYKTVSKIVENGDLLSNQLLVNIPFDYYESNDELIDLLETRKTKWIDKIREKGNPDVVVLEGTIYKLIRLEEDTLIIESELGEKKRILPNLIVEDFMPLN